MFQTQYPSPFTSLKRKSLSDLVDHPAKRQAVMPPVEPPIAPARNIQPRPPPPNGYMTAPPVTSSSGLTAAGKKRGRPSKADKEAQARANQTRATEYAPITPAPLAPAVAQPQREYMASPAYEVAGGPHDQRQNKRGRPPTADTTQQPTGAYPLASPASTTGTPRGLPEPLEHAEKGTVSPHDRPIDSRSPPLPHLQQQDIPHIPHSHSPIQHRQPPPPPPPLLHPARPGPPYEHYRVDPIFPDRDRSRVEQPPKTSSPASISASRV